MKLNKKYKVSFNSELKKVKSALLDISFFLATALPDMSAEDKNELKLIFSELICNAVIHGNGNDSKKTVDVEIEVTNDSVFSIVKDQGPGFDHLNFLKSLDSCSEYNQFKDHGRGIWLVYSLSDTLSFNLAGNEIKFHKKVN